MKKLIAVALALVAMLAVTACGEHQGNKSDYSKVLAHAKHRHAYIPQNDVEFKNYNDSQRLYDDPSTIIWCSTTWGNASAPLVTVPVAGKLTSSTTSYFSSEHWDGDSDGNVVLPSRSVDGLYHPNPPQYRYGFTPGGQYVDFFNMPTFCTTALTKFQRQQTKVALSVDSQAKLADKRAQDALKRGDKKEAQRILEGLGGG